MSNLDLDLIPYLLFLNEGTYNMLGKKELREKIKDLERASHILPIYLVMS